MRRHAIVLLTFTGLILGTVFVAPGRSLAAETPTTSQVTTPSAGNAALEVSGISLEKGEAGETFVDVATTRSAAFRVLHLSSPARLVVDVEGARKATPRGMYHADSPLLKDVRVGQFRATGPAVVRVVVDLNGTPTCDVHAVPGGLRIELRPHGMAKAAAPAAKQQATKPVEVAEGKAPRPATISLPKPETDNLKPITPQPAEAETPQFTKVDYQSTLPGRDNAQQVAAAPRPAPPKETPEALRAEKAARTLSATADTPQAAQGRTVPAAGAGEDQPKYTGEPISLNLKDVDLKDFFRLIHEISGLNIIVDPNVTGSVTMVLDSVPWDQALDIVLKNNGLGKVLEGNVLRIARMSTLTAEQENTKKLTMAREDTAPLVTVFHQVNYAKASAIAALLKSWAGGGALSRRGTVLVDDRANTLIISDIQQQIPVIENIIKKLDTKAKQVQIEARIMLATTSFTRDLQSALSGGAINPSGSTLVGGVTGAKAGATPDVTFTPGQVSQSIKLTPTGAVGFGAIAVSNASGRYLINAAIAAAETKSQAKTISRPTIVTQDNIEGMVQQGAQIPIQTSINNTISIQYVNATLTLQVTPQVTDDGNIFLNIRVTNASPGPVLTSAGPSINTQSATTQVLVPNGGTVVFGGITVTDNSKSATYVPLLGQIPILGHLFKTSNVSKSDRELLFFVSPKVLPT
jgi:type IV pilus secretin PilQ/predicted competence protein